MSGSWNGKKPVSLINILHQKSNSDSSCDGTKIKIFDFTPASQFYFQIKTTTKMESCRVQCPGSPEPPLALNHCINLWWVN